MGIECEAALGSELRRPPVPATPRIATCIFIGLILAGVAVSETQELRGTPEYEVKAAFLLNFAKFVEWPPHAFEDPDQPIRLAIIGRDPFGTSLERLVEEYHVRGRAVVIERLESVSDLDDCQVLFIAVSEPRRLREILDHVAGEPILTVGESRRFLESGGMIRFKLMDRKVRFEIAQDTADRSGLRVSSRLMSVSDHGRTP
jgi:hypothetical protein